MAEKHWKAQERRVARLLNATRNQDPATREVDVQNDWLQVQVYDRENIPQWLTHAADRAAATADPKHLPAVALTSGRNGRILMIVDIIHWTDWFLESPRPEATEKI